MISTNDFKTGMTIDYEGNLFPLIVIIKYGNDYHTTKE